MGVRRAVFDLDDRGRPATEVLAARGVPWAALHREDGRAVAVDAARPAAVADVYQQTQRWLAAGSFEAILHDLGALLRLAEGRRAEPTAVVFDSQTLQSIPESGAHGGYDGYKRRKGSKIHIAVDTLGHLLALVATPANAQDRAQVAELSRTVQDVTDGTVEVAFVDQGYTGARPAAAAAAHGSRLDVVKLSEAKRGFVLLPRRWVVERSFAWKSRFRRLVRDSERRLSVLAGLHLVAFACLELTRAVPLLHSAYVHNSL